MKRYRYATEYRTPTPVREPLISQAEMVARIEAFRAEMDIEDGPRWPEPAPLPVGPVATPVIPWLRRSA